MHNQDQAVVSECGPGLHIYAYSGLKETATGHFLRGHNSVKIVVVVGKVQRLAVGTEDRRSVLTI